MILCATIDGGTVGWNTKFSIIVEKLSLWIVMVYGISVYGEIVTAIQRFGMKNNDVKKNNNFIVEKK